VFLVFVQGNNFLVCCEAADYSVTVGDVPCPIAAAVLNALSCKPNREKPPESDFDKHGGSRVMVISSALSFYRPIFNGIDLFFYTVFHDRSISYECKQ